MKFAISALALCLVLGGSTTAMADGHKSNLGVGVGSTPFVQGIDIRLGLTDDIGIEGIVGFNTISLDDGMDGSNTVTSFDLGARALYGLWAFGPRATVFGFGGLSIGTETDQDTLIGIEGGLKTELFLVDHFSVSVDFGLAIGINEADGTGMGSGTAIDIGTGSLFGGASATFWW